MSLEEKGLYFELLTFQWMKGQIPEGDDLLIAKIASTSVAEVTRLWSPEGSRVRAKFNLIPGRGWVNQDLEEIRGRKQRIGKVRSRVGRLGGISKKGNGSKAIASDLPELCLSKPLVVNKNPSLSSSNGPGKNHEIPTEVPRGNNAPILLKQNGSKTEAKLEQIWAAIQAEHPRGHNPKPNLACQLFLSRFDDATAAAALRQHREVWQPAWVAGRMVPDLHNWIRDWHPEADVAGQKREVDSLSERIKEL